MNELNSLINACVFAAEKHKFQRRKGCLKIPYINHTLKVCKILQENHENDINLLIAAVLHDTIEDTQTSEEEIIKLFGDPVLKLVLEVTDDMSLPSKQRKELQIEKAPHLSNHAKLIKIADKLCNIEDLINYPIQWNITRKIEYVEWAQKVVDKCKGINQQLDKAFYNICKKALQQFKP